MTDDPRTLLAKALAAKADLGQALISMQRQTVTQERLDHVRRKQTASSKAINELLRSVPIPVPVPV